MSRVPKCRLQCPLSWTIELKTSSARRSSSIMNWPLLFFTFSNKHFVIYFFLKYVFLTYIYISDVSDVSYIMYKSYFFFWLFKTTSHVRHCGSQRPSLFLPLLCMSEKQRAWARMKSIQHPISRTHTHTLPPSHHTLSYIQYKTHTRSTRALLLPC